MIKTKTTTIFLLLTLAAIVTAGGLFVWRGKPQVQASETVDLNAAGQAVTPFIFDSAATNGWYAGPANETSLAVFGSRETKDTHFAYINYKEDGLSQSQWLANLENRAKDYPGYNFIRGDVLPAVLNTSTSPIHYQLYSYKNQLKSGAEIGPNGLNDAEVHGYIPYGNGYFVVQGYATPGDLLPEVIEAIRAFSFDAGKQTF